MLGEVERRRAFESIASQGGGLSMVAMDQRESLRTMFAGVPGEPAGDETLMDFKMAVTEILSPVASAILLDARYGVPAMSVRSPSCGLIVAADRLDQPPAESVRGTDLDGELDLDAVHRQGATALKLLVLWYAGDDQRREKDLVRRFVELSRTAGFLSVVEGVVRPPRDGGPWDREGEILDAASELGGLGCDLYRVEAPMHGRGDREVIRERCEAITAVLPCPWVVHASGVTPRDVARAVEAACRGGASGFLAGRAVWMDLVGPGDYRARLRKGAVERLERLRDVVDACARPWSTAYR